MIKKSKFENKKLLRKRMIKKRFEISESAAKTGSHSVCEALSARARGRVVCSYMAFRGEVDLAELHAEILGQSGGEPSAESGVYLGADTAVRNGGTLTDGGVRDGGVRIDGGDVRCGSGRLGRGVLLLPRVEELPDEGGAEAAGQTDPGSQKPKKKLKTMHFYEVRSKDDFVISNLGILEPVPSRCKKWEDEDIWNSNPLVLTPGVAFTKDGGRMGYGGGFYDRFFEKRPDPKTGKKRGEVVGICFREQLVTHLPLEPHDIRLDEVCYAPKGVLLGLSGGVDSAAAAYLLKEQGYDVVGAYLQMSDDRSGDSLVGPSDDASGDSLDGPSDDASGDSLGGTSAGPLDTDPKAEDARRVAEALGISFIKIDLRREFERIVIKNFEEEYIAGRTPSPCVLCNRELKIEALRRAADALELEYIATGHYARIEKNTATGRFEILPAKALKKDQGYMLSRLTQEQLSKLLTPLADLESKEGTRKLAAQALGSRDLGISQKKDSQEICFVDYDYARFLHERGAFGREGCFVFEGQRVRKHEGVENYTIGQRKGLGAFGKPVYVVGIDAESGDVTVGDDSELYKSGLEASGLHYVGLSDGSEIGRCRAKIRYAAAKADCSVTLLGEGRIRISFDEPQRAITPGQTVVLYSLSEESLGEEDSEKPRGILASAVIDRAL